MRGILLFLFLFGFESLYSKESIVLTDKIEELVVDPSYSTIYKDSSRTLTAKEIVNCNFNLDRVDFNSSNWKNSNYWVKFTIKNNSKNDRWVLEVLEFGIHEIGFYDVKNDRYTEAGYMESFDKRPYKHKNFVYALEIPKGEERTFFLKVHSSSGSGFGPAMKIRTDRIFFAYANKEYLLLGLYYGLLILAMSYNLFIYLGIKDKSHLFYVFYVLSIGLKSLQEDGLGFQYLWPSFPPMNYVLDFAPQLLLLSFSAYAIYFFEFRKNYRNYYKTILFFVTLYFSCYIIDKFFPLSFIRLVYLSPFIVIYGISLLMYLNKYKPARFFVLGYSLLIASQIITFIRYNNEFSLENNFIILLLVYSLNIGFVIEVYIFSVAMADKLKIFKEEKETAQHLIIEQLKINEELKDKVNKELEQKVVERTSELESAKTKLQEQAEIINRMNQTLDKEIFSLKSSMKEINKDRGLLKALSYEEFTKTFPDENSCYRFIEELKWGNGYVCKKCNNDKFTKSTGLFSKKCSRCDYIETIKSHTIFHNVKFPIEKAFGLIYLTLSAEGEVSTYVLADKLKLQQKTCWSFRQRVLNKIKVSNISKKDLIEKGWSILIKE